ncbi:MAG: hypothetical protein GX066_01665 [Clostridiaceae bacterium]|nr:hypothetical protein [Clostridiaceae bacterium]
MKKAVAIKYEPGKENVPIITAVGKGLVAEKIMQAADDSGVPIVEDEFQTNALASFNVGDKVPKFLYDLVAEILIFVEEMDCDGEVDYL